MEKRDDLGKRLGQHMRFWYFSLLVDMVDEIDLVL